MNAVTNALRLRQLLFILIVVLTFEGLARKVLPDLGVQIFLLKDLLVAVMTFYVFLMPPARAISFLWTAYKTICVLFVPLIMVTAWHDPLLAIFGTKQYLLFPMVGFATFYGFQFTPMEKIFTFFRWIALLIIPTAALALVETRLPHNHWLNETVTGDSLEAFSAGGQLRVSSTFSFVAQYCAFLNAQLFIVMVAFSNRQRLPFLWKLLLYTLPPLLVFSSFITGSRGAVVGNIAIVLAAGALSMVRFQMRNIIHIAVVMGALYLLAQLVYIFSPQTVAAYFARENGQLVGISSDNRTRVFESYFSISQDKSLSTMLGNGLGLMSNGADTFSVYAAQWRSSTWTETDFSSTLFEGGYYLVAVWYGFRLFIVGMTTVRFVRGVTEAYSVPASLVQGNVIVIGMVGTLGIQPPVAIWWWFGVGISLVFWWKSVGPGDREIPQGDAPVPLRRLPRGRSLYADVLHPGSRPAAHRPQ